MRYKITEKNEVYIWNDSQKEPIIYQPHYPSGIAFSDYESAKKWAEEFIVYSQNPENNPYPLDPEK